MCVCAGPTVGGVLRGLLPPDAGDVPYVHAAVQTARPQDVRVERRPVNLTHTTTQPHNHATAAQLRSGGDGGYAGGPDLVHAALVALQVVHGLVAVAQVPQLHRAVRPARRQQVIVLP